MQHCNICTLYIPRPSPHAIDCRNRDTHHPRAHIHLTHESEKCYINLGNPKSMEHNQTSIKLITHILSTRTGANCWIPYPNFKQLHSHHYRNAQEAQPNQLSNPYRIKLVHFLFSTFHAVFILAGLECGISTWKILLDTSSTGLKIEWNTWTS